MKFERFGLGIAKGMAVTLRHLFRQPITTQYPEERLDVSRRLRGNELVWSEERCTGCVTCAKSCPQGAIAIETSVPEDSSGDNNYKVEKFEVDSGYCIFCGLCVESCPYDALFFSHEYEKSRYRRREVVKAKEDLAVSGQKRISSYGHPEYDTSLPPQTLLVEGNRGSKKSRFIRDIFDDRLTRAAGAIFALIMAVVIFNIYSGIPEQNPLLGVFGFSLVPVLFVAGGIVFILAILRS